MADTPDILKKIVDCKREEVARASSATSVAELRSRIADMEERPRGFEQALRDRQASGRTAIIAEVKKGSPSKGIIRAGFDPPEIARTYARNGATCLSILTEERFFLGSLVYLATIRKEVTIPLLRKDFLFDPYQVYEARAAGADAILLIAAMLELGQIEDLAGVARELSLDVLLEVHDEQELETALASGCTLLGINNRDLRTFVTDLGVTERLATRIPADRFIVAESGVRDREDILRLQRADARAFLVGESLMREADFGAKLRELIGE